MQMMQADKNAPCSRLYFGRGRREKNAPPLPPRVQPMLNIILKRQ